MSRVEASDDLYRRLGVGPTASIEEIGAAFRARAKTLHPDLHPGDAAIEDEFKALTHAYDVLTSPAARTAYDQRRSGRAPVSSTPSTTGTTATTHSPVFRTPRAARAAIWWG